MNKKGSKFWFGTFFLLNFCYNGKICLLRGLTPGGDCGIRDAELRLLTLLLINKNINI